MIGKLGFAGLVGILLAGSVVSASALGPIKSMAGNVSGKPDVLDVSFFSRPYPYGYTGWGPCVRYVEVQTRWGLRLRRVRVCR